ncbi:MAG: sigma 54-interacting transcriptional regulator [Bdellovibrionales bacterium]|nr:sigma 54-interacting transcriptional regulator [Bdellovibrionales bacterium]
MTEIITGDRRMKDLIQLARTVAQSKATILIQGESGTGKELMAALVHESSSRASKPFVAINCAAIPENLLESELFGYERGAFTGAVNSKAGKFEFANGGTLFLDEISEMDIRLQAKLLRVIQEGEVDRIGGRKPIAVDVRIIATTNRNLADCVREGSFREDLFYRLNVVNLTLPPLRERTGDVSLIARHFAEIFAKKNNRRIAGISPDSLAVLEAHTWNGNIRELENVIEGSVLTCVDGAMIQPANIRIEYRRPLISKSIEPQLDSAVLLDASGWTPGRTLDQIEKNVILDALKHHEGNRTHTARALGISIRTLRNKLADYRRDGLNV